MKNNLQMIKFQRSKWFSFLFVIMAVLSFNTVNAQQKVKNIVLIHGAFADGSGWEGVYRILTKHGYNVSVVGNPNTGLADDAEATRRVLERQDGPAILVGHSYGGAIITEIGLEKNVAGLVFVAAFVPDAGESLLQLAQSGPPSPNSGILPPQSGFLCRCQCRKSSFYVRFANSCGLCSFSGAHYQSRVENKTKLVYSGFGGSDRATGRPALYGEARQCKNYGNQRQSCCFYLTAGRSCRSN
ncbi:alpha/beta hydrolase family protein [Flavobacterium circumlabens]|uniref:Alpha/beta hydrolase family protein n=1 Tax=Flavobacterium circumlabens TaxID=2133765 RepID=A0ABY2AYK9_9FLAO|nr:alpha/beta hydrolase [Flavobacterium circumlabens]TCN56542.1 alpha/beta hydrolase family protein [Flavobacterium circumlabens]